MNLTLPRAWPDPTIPCCLNFSRLRGGRGRFHLVAALPRCALRGRKAFHNKKAMGPLPMAFRMIAGGSGAGQGIPKAMGGPTFLNSGFLPSFFLPSSWPTFIASFLPENLKPILPEWGFLSTKICLKYFLRIFSFRPSESGKRKKAR